MTDDSLVYVVPDCEFGLGPRADLIGEALRVFIAQVLSRLEDYQVLMDPRQHSLSHVSRTQGADS